MNFYSAANVNVSATYSIFALGYSDFFVAGLAQLVEQLPCKHQVASSNPAAGTKILTNCIS